MTWSPRLLRQLHLYTGMLIAPSILFFALSGALQLFGLHEAEKGRAYTPPPVIEKLSEVHIHQRFALKPKRKGPPPATPVTSAQPAPAKAEEPESVPPIKWVFLAVAIGLLLSTLLGLWMGLTQGRNRRLAFALLVIGAMAPVLLLAF